MSKPSGFPCLALQKEGDGKVQDYFDEVGLNMVTNSQVITNFEFLFDLDVLSSCFVSSRFLK
jgi:hypothetical protein